MAIDYVHGATEFSLTSDSSIASGLHVTDQARLLRSAIDDLLMATIPEPDSPQPASRIVSFGRRQEPSGGHHGYLTWASPDSPDIPRIEISPDQVITLWQHWPGPDPAPSTGLRFPPAVTDGCTYRPQPFGRYTRSQLMPTASQTPDSHATKIAAAIQKAVAPSLVILHGSRARGDHRPDSDLDLLIVSVPEADQNTSAGQAAAAYMRSNPPALDLDIVSIPIEDFQRLRHAKQHIAGQADHWGTYMSDYSIGHHDDYRNQYPMHWPATRRRLEHAAEWSKQFNDMVDENSWNQKLLGFSAQQAVENAMRGINSAHNDPTIFRHYLDHIWTHYLHNHHDHTAPRAQDLRRAVDDLLLCTTYADRNSPTSHGNWLTDYATEYRYNRNPRPMDQDQKAELRVLVNDAIDRLADMTHQISGTSEADTFPDGKPWE